MAKGLKIGIIGGGPAGLIAAREMRIHFDAKVTIFDPAFAGHRLFGPPMFIESHSSLSELRIRAKEVTVRETLVADSLVDAPLNYSMKTNRMFGPNRVMHLGRDPKISTWLQAIDPIDDLLRQVSGSVKLVHSSISEIRKARGMVFLRGEAQHGLEPAKGFFDWVISTIPFSGLSSLLSRANFHHDRPISYLMYSATAPFRMAPDFVDVVYNGNTGPDDWWSRSVLFNGLISIESESYADDDEVRSFHQYGFDWDVNWNGQKRTDRFVPADKSAMDAEIASITKEYKVLSLGRLAMLRYKRMEHLPEDVKTIIRVIKES